MSNDFIQPQNTEIVMYQTAAEKTYFSADSSKPNMGLYSFSGSYPSMRFLRELDESALRWRTKK